MPSIIRWAPQPILARSCLGSATRSSVQLWSARSTKQGNNPWYLGWSSPYSKCSWRWAPPAPEPSISGSTLAGTANSYRRRIQLKRISNCTSSSSGWWCSTIKEHKSKSCNHLDLPFSCQGTYAMQWSSWISHWEVASESVWAHSHRHQMGSSANGLPSFSISNTI